MSQLIDLRSDTVTRPGDAMRDAMASALVGDMQYGDDPALNALEERVAALLGKQRALWFPSGTMANQVALRLLTKPGDDVIVSREAHSVWHEAGASAAFAGVQLTEIGNDGVFTAEDVRQAVKPGGISIFPRTTLVQIENTHNRMGGVVFPQDEAVAVCEMAGDLGMATYLDGARLWNAAAATGLSPAELAASFDVVAVAFSKGLGAPAGSMLAFDAERWSEADIWRRRYGGAMRQIGMLAAAADFALTNNLDRLPEDHTNARDIAIRLHACPDISLELATVQTNIIVFQLAPEIPAPQLVEAAKAQGVLINALGPHMIRMLTHLDVSADDCVHAANVILAELDRLRS